MKSVITTFAALVALAVSLQAGQALVPDISHAQLKKAIAEKKVTLIDVNGTESWQKGHIPGAIDFESKEKELASTLPADKTALIVAYCGNEQCPAYKLGAKAALALGYKNVKHYAGGIEGWMKKEEVEKAGAKN